jgi:hypothetical protein
MFQEKYHQIERMLRACTGEEDVLLTTGGDHADLASTVAFKLAKKQKRAPAKIAGDIAGTLAADPDLGDIQVEAAGPYVNFRFGPSLLAEAVREALEPGYGKLPRRSERVVLEHTSANPNGPLHVGHIRNTVIGDSLARAFRKAGYPLEVQYYLNDMGRQVAIVAWGLDHLGIAREEGEKEDHYVARVYVAANREIRENPDITEEIDLLMQEVERGDPETAGKFRAAVSLCVEGIKATLAALNAHHDRFVWESDFVRIGDVDRVIEQVRRLPQAHEDETLWVDLSEQGHPIFEITQRLRETYLSMGFDEAMNPLIVEEADIYRQFGPEAMAVLDRVFYLGGLPRPNVGIARKRVEEIEAILGQAVSSETEERLRETLHGYKKGTIDGDELTHELATVLAADDATVVRIMDEVFPEFRALAPESYFPTRQGPGNPVRARGRRSPVRLTRSNPTRIPPSLTSAV